MSRFWEYTKGIAIGYAAGRILNNVLSPKQPSQQEPYHYGNQGYGYPGYDNGQNGYNQMEYSQPSNNQPQFDPMYFHEDGSPKTEQEIQQYREQQEIKQASMAAFMMMMH